MKLFKHIHENLTFKNQIKELTKSKNKLKMHPKPKKWVTQIEEKNKLNKKKKKKQNKALNQMNSPIVNTGTKTPAGMGRVFENTAMTNWNRHTQKKC